VKMIVGLDPGRSTPSHRTTPAFCLDRIAEDFGATLANRRHRALTGKATIAGEESAGKRRRI